MEILRKSKARHIYLVRKVLLQGELSYYIKKYQKGQSYQKETSPMVTIFYSQSLQGFSQGFSHGLHPLKSCLQSNLTPFRHFPSCLHSVQILQCFTLSTRRSL